jgi:serine/threonine protein kinase
VTETIGQYQVLDRLGVPGTVDVFRARDTRLGRTVALRWLTAAITDDPLRRAALIADARAAAALSDPHIAALYEAGEHEGRLFVASEFVPGDTLTRVVAGQPLNPRRAAEFAAQLADGLAEAHARGLVHRDVRPDNIIITPKGQAKLIELGLSPYTRGGAQRAAASRMIDTDAVAPADAILYLSPEQALGEPTDPRTDIFSLGAVLYTMLTGEPPFQAATAAGTVLAVL